MTPEVRAIREGEYEACIDLWQTVWPGDDRSYFTRYFFGDHDFQNDYCRVCVVDGKIVSAAQIVKRRVACGDFSLTMGGIANVATLPEYRGRGYNTACLRQAIAVMEADAMDFSLLFTGIPDFYTRLGWESIAGQSLTGVLRNPLPKLFRYASVRRYEDRDDAALHLIYAAFNRARPITVHRSAPYWRDWIRWWQGSAPGEARVAEQDGVVVGYCLYRFRSNETLIAEIGVRKGAEAAIDALLEEAASASLQRGIDRIRFLVPATREVLGSANRLCAKIERGDISHGMARLLHRDSLPRGLAPELTDRWMRAGMPPGGLTLETPYGPTRIEARDAFLHITETDDRMSNDQCPMPNQGQRTTNKSTHTLSQADFFALLIGRGLPEERLSGQDAVFARALFPPFDAWYWDLDGF